jgi:hypothetical protein
MTIKILNKFIFLIVGFFSLIIFLTGKNITAFDWPATDMGVFFERFADSNFLPNDFFTNASSTPNPRYIFGYFIVFLTKIFFTNWYNIFFFLKVFFVIFIPSLTYQMIVSFFRDKSIKNNFGLHLINAAMMIYLLSDIDNFGVAWWPSLYYFVSAQTTSFFFGICAISILNYSANKSDFSWQNFFGVALFCFSTLLHPSIGLMLFIFYFLFNYAINNQLKLKKNILFFLIIILVPYLILYFSFSPLVSLSAERFIQIYVVYRHAAHYLPSKFGSLGGNNWQIVFIKINSIFLITFFIGFLRKDLQIIKIAIASILIYSGSAFMQYLGIELFKIKIIAVIGPSRAMSLGYWMIMFCLTIIFVKNKQLLIKYNLIIYKNFKLIIVIFSKKINIIYLNQQLKKINIQLLLIYKYFLRNFTIIFKFINQFSVIKISIFLILINFIIFKILIDDPFQKNDQDSLGMLSWIKNNLENDDVILTDSYPIEIPILSKRSVISGGFPFREDFFEEFYQRERLIKQMKYFSKKQLQEFSKKFKFNYVIFKIDDDHLLKTQTPIYVNQKYVIYKI